jgi:hypothetical protein
VVSVVHQWNPDDWETFSLSLLQHRHGHLNIQRIPATHGGDFGIDFYSTSDSVIYQCFAAEEPIDVTIRANRQKKKITTDLKKMVDGHKEVSDLFLGVPVKRWVLLVPLHDSKEVSLHCSKKTIDLRSLSLSHLDKNFEVCINDQSSFPGASLAASMASLANISLNVQVPTNKELADWQAGSPNLIANASAKLSKRKLSTPVQHAVTDGVELFLKSNALVDALRSSAPDLHERVVSAISSRVRRLSYMGPQGGPMPINIMNTELNNLISVIKDAVPNLSPGNVEDIALGTLSDWIMRCPLDFPSSEN